MVPNQPKKLIFDRALKAEQAYWIDKLGAEIPRSSLMPDAEPLDQAEPCQGCVTIALPSEVYQRLEALTQGSLFLVYTTLLATLKICLHKYSGDLTINVGSPPQKHQDAEAPLTNALCIVDTLQPSMPFKQLLLAVRQTLTEAYQHQRYPFQHLLNDLKLDQSADAASLFTIALTLDPFHAALLDTGHAMTIAFTKQAHQLHGRIEYDARRWKSSTIERFAGHFITLLADAVHHPTKAIGDLQMLTPGEQQQLLEIWNQPEQAPADDDPIQRLFERQVEQRPHAPAVIFEDEQLTYHQLNARATMLAAQLQQMGLEPDARVGLYVERSLDLIVGLLAILKAGGAYVPLDPGWPLARVVSTLEDAHAVALLTQPHLQAQLPANTVPTLGVPSTWDDSEAADVTARSTGVHANQLAYVIYTSGSTGTPKGVAVEHRHLLNYVQSLQARLELPAETNFATVTTIAADLGNTAIFLALCTGGCLHLIAQERATDPAAFIEYTRRHAIDCLKIVPSHLSALLTAREPALALPRRQLILGGERCSWELIEQVRALVPECSILNHYGPTETTIGVLTYSVPPTRPEHTPPTVPIGRPLHNTRAYILNAQLQLLPVGVIGELYIGGATVTRGYLASPALTAQRFIPDCFSQYAGARLYKTGDRARYLPDGAIEFVGRHDDQIKIRGFRVEPREIEHVLREHPGIAEAMVLAQADTPDQQRLIACVVPKPAYAPTAGGRQRYVLPNNLAVVHLNKNETEYLFEEIFEKQAYIRHGIQLADNACVFDVGANIGLFSLFVNQLVAQATIYAFEPIPETFAALQANLELYSVDARMFNLGLSHTAEQTKFTFFPKFSILSGRYADKAVEKEVVRSFIANQQQLDDAAADLLHHADEILEDRFRSTTIAVELRRISDLIRDHAIDHIDLLKINVEKSELDVLHGISAEDWPKIQQIILEVDVEAHLEQIQTLLEQHGYHVVIDQDPLLTNTSLFYVYAIQSATQSQRDAHSHALAAARPDLYRYPQLITQDALRSFLHEKLPEYMVPATYLLLDALPLTPNGKIDRAALLMQAQANLRQAGGGEAPRTPVEELLSGIWTHVLGLEQIGVHDNFFDLGGHSLLVTRVIAHIRDVLKTELSVRDVFDAPTIAALAQCVTAARATAPAQIPPLVPAARDQGIPLAFGQQRLWFLNQLDPDSPVYSTHAAVHIRGRLHQDALERALNEVVRRHEVLRTTFHVIDGVPVQIIAPPQVVSLPVIDLTPLTHAERMSTLECVLAEEGAHSFDLSTGPLVRASLLILDSAEHVLLLSVHHSVFDAWSRGIFMEEVAALYQAFAAVQPAPLHPLPIQYADFTLWQRQWIGGQLTADQLAYWQRQLHAAPMLMLPTDRPRPAVQTFRGAFESFTAPSDLLSGLKALSTREGTTLFMTLLAAFQTLLYRYTGQEDISVSTGASTRTHPSTEQLVGFFVSTLVLRVDLSGRPTFRELLRRVREVALDAYAHQDVPFEQVVDALRPVREASYNPLFQVALVFQNVPSPSLDLPELSIDFLKVGNATSKVDLTFNFRERGDELTGTLEYNTDLFDSATIVRMVAHFRNILEHIVADPAQPISQIQLLTEAEQHLFAAWNATDVEYQGPTCLHQRFEAQAARTPDAIAVVGSTGQLTYQELNRKANHLAYRLRAAGVGPEVCVGVYGERSLEVVIGLLAILKAGGAYVPLDPAYPRERSLYIIQDIRPAVLLIQPQLRERLPTLELPVIDLDSAVSEEGLDANPESGVSGANLVYVIYTSGSTGTPKGVLIPHAGICNLIEAQIQRWSIGPSSRVLQLASLSFDASVSEMFMALLSGATLYLGPHEVAQVGSDLVTYLQRNAITTVTLPPSLLAVLPDTPLPMLHTLIVAGEACSPDLVTRWAPGRRMFNGYGPTEITVGATAGECVVNGSKPPIGRPFANTQVYILDRQLQQTPIGVPGDLYISGVGVARGYYGQPALTAEKFIPDLVSGKPGARLYNTGDLGRYLPDGNIEFLSRSDRQVKIRGFRVEPQEIEAVLQQHPGVQDAVVLVQGSSPATNQLAAYVATETRRNQDVEHMRLFLKQRLPEYMVPTAWALLPTLPLTPNGKVDRAALQALEQPTLPTTSVIEPRTAQEAQLVEIWRQVLGVTPLGIDDNFFTLGGDSLLAIRVVTRAQQAGLALTTRDLFQYQTIAELAASSRQQPAVVIQHAAPGPMPLLATQYNFLDADHANPHCWNIVLLSEVHQQLDPLLVQQVVAALLNHHAVLNMRFARTETGWRARLDRPDPSPVFTQLDLTTTPVAERRTAIEVATAQFQQRLHLDHGPLLRVVLFDLGPDAPGRLLVITHHIITDAISMHILIEDFVQAYQQLSRGEPIHLPASTTPVNVWAQRLIEYAQSAESRDDARDWLRLLWDLIQPLPVDVPAGRQHNTVASSRGIRQVLEVAETTALAELAQAQQVQMRDILLTAVAHAFVRWSGCPVLLVEVLMHGRNQVFADVDLARTVGMIATGVPVVLDLREAHSLKAALHAVYTQVRQLPKGGLTYPALRHLIQDPDLAEQMRALPTREILFNYISELHDDLPAPGIFRPAQESAGSGDDPQAERGFLLSLTINIINGQLRLGLGYSQEVHHDATIRQLASDFMQALHMLIHNLDSPFGRQT